MKDLFIPDGGTLVKMTGIYILVFKTNISLKKDIKIISALLNDHPAVLKWNIDLSDIDKVLRIESTLNNSAEIIFMTRQAGYHCEELPG